MKNIMKKVPLGLIAIALLVGFSITSAPAEGRVLLMSEVIGTEGAINGAQPIAGVNSGGVRWLVEEGVAKINLKNGKLEVEVLGLVREDLGTPGTTTLVRASLVCSGVVVATTGVFPLSSAGDAEIDEKITLPTSCDDPIVLVRAGTGAGNYLALAIDFPDF